MAVLLRHRRHGLRRVEDLDEVMALLTRLAHVHGGIARGVLQRGVGAIGHELGDSVCRAHRAGVHERRPTIPVNCVQVHLLLDQLRKEARRGMGRGRDERDWSLGARGDTR